MKKFMSKIVSIIDETKNSELKRYYLLIADDQTWKIALKNELFGFSKKGKGIWKTTQVGEYVGFYATSPIKKIIGFGKITEKFTDRKLVFPDELFHKKPLWPYRISMEPISIQKKMDDGISIPSDIILNVSRKVVTEKQFFSFIQKADSNWNTNMENIIFKKIKIKK